MQFNINRYNDEELFANLAVASHRDACFTELYRRYERRVWAYARISLQNEHLAKDAVQETFYRLLKSGEIGTKIEKFAPYIMRIIRNLILNEQKKNGAMTLEDFNFDSIPSYSLSTNYEQVELNALFETALSLLIEEHKDAFVMQLIGGLSYSEIAQVQKVPLTTVRNRIVRAKSRIREFLLSYISIEELQR